MTTKDQEEVYLYLSSIGSTDTFPKNNASSFENRILPLNLDPNREYEVGLTNILFPKYYYILKEGDVDCSIGFHSRIQQSMYDDYEYNFYTYSPNRNVISNLRDGSIPSIISTVNEQLWRELKEILKELHSDYFPYKQLLHYDLELGRVIIHKMIVGGQADRLYTDLSITFNPQIALVLGFEPHTRYSIFHKKEEISESERALEKVTAPYPCRSDGGNDYIYVYSDIITPTRFANQIVNIIDAIPLPNDVSSKGINPIMYLPLSKSSFDSVGIKITNQNGKPIHFEDNHSITCILHIRPK